MDTNTLETTSTFRFGEESYFNGEISKDEFAAKWKDHPDVIAGWNAAATEVGCIEDLIQLT